MHFVACENVITATFTDSFFCCLKLLRSIFELNTACDLSKCLVSIFKRKLKLFSFQHYHLAKTTTTKKRWNKNI